MAELSSLIITGNHGIDPLTGLEVTKKNKQKYTVKPTESQYIAAGLQQQDASMPMQNLALGLESTSKYDTELTAEQINFGRFDTEALEENRADNQSSGRAAAFALGKFALKTGINIIGGTAGTIYGLSAAASSGKFKDLYDNEVINTLDEWSKGLDSAMPVYKSRDYKNANFLEKMLRPVMFMDEVSDAAAFTAGAVLTEMLTAGVSSAYVVPKALKYLNATKKTLDKASKASKVAGAVAEGGERTLLNNLGRFGRQTLTGANYEASIGANQATRNLRISMVNDYMKVNGITDPNEIPDDEMDRIEDYVQNAGLGVWAKNMAILNVSNMVQFPKTFGAGFDVARKYVPQLGKLNVLGRIGKSGLSTEAEGIIATGKIAEITKGERIFRGIASRAKNPLTEGLWEEGMQGVVSRTGEDYWRKRYNSGNINNAVSYAESFGKALVDTYGTKEGWNEIGMGMLIGGIGAPGKGLLPGKMGKKESGERADLWQGGIFGESDYAKSRKAKSSILDKVMAHGRDTNVALKAGIQNLFTSQGNAQDAQDATSKGNKFGYINAQEDDFYSYASARYAAGLSDTVDEQIDSMEEMSPEKFKQEFFDQADDRVIDKAKQTELINKLRAQHSKIKEAKRLMNNFVQTDPQEDYDEPLETYKDHMAYLLSKAEFLDMREEELVKLITDESGNFLDGRTIKEIYNRKNALGLRGDNLKIFTNTRKGLNLYRKKAAKELDSLQAQAQTVQGEIDTLTTSLENNNKQQEKLLTRLQSKEGWEDAQTEKEELEKSLEENKKEAMTIQEKLNKKTASFDINKNKITTIEEQISRKQAEYNTLLAEEHKERQKKSIDPKHSNLSYSYNNYEDFVESIEKLIDESEEYAEKVNKYYEYKPLNAEKISPYIEDLGKIYSMRQDLINLYNYHQTAQGRKDILAKMAAMHHDRDKEINELISKIATVESEFEVGKTYKITYLKKGTSPEGVEEFVETTEIFTGENTGDPEALRKAYVNKERKALFLDTIPNLIRNGIVINITLISEDEVKEEEVKDNLGKLGIVNKSDGTYLLPGVLGTDKTTGEEYHIVTYTDTRANTSYFVYFHVNSDGTIGPRYLPIEDQPDINTLEMSDKLESRKFDGILGEYTTRNNSKFTVMYSHESPFLFEEEAKAKRKYPKTLRYSVVGSGTESATNDPVIITELVDLAHATLSSGNGEFLKGTNKPIITYKEQPTTIDYTIADKKSYSVYKRGRNNKSYKQTKYYYTLPGQQKVSAIELDLFDKSVEEIEALIESGTFSSEHVGNLTGTKAKLTNYSIEDIEIIADDFTSKSGGRYVIFKKGGKLYAAKKIAKLFTIFEDTNQVASYGFPLATYTKEEAIKAGDISLQGKPNWDRLTLFGENDLEGELGVKSYATPIHLSKQYPHLMFVAGREFEVEWGTAESGNRYPKDVRDADGNLIRNADPNQQRWYKFLKTFKDAQEIEEFKRTHSLKVITNTHPDWAKYFEGNPKTGINTDGSIDSMSFNSAEIKVIIVDKKIGNPIQFEGEDLFNTIHIPNFENFDSTNDLTKEKIVNAFKEFRSLILTTVNSHPEHKPELYLDITNITAGRPIYEASQETEVVNAEGAKTIRQRARKNIFGRLIKEGTSPIGVSWTIITSMVDGNNRVAIPGEVIINGKTYQVAKTTNLNLVGQVMSAIIGANGEAIPITLLTRQTNEEEAITVAALLKMVANGVTSFNKESIIPEAGEKLSDANFLLKKFIKYGKNKNANASTQLYWDTSSKTIKYGKESLTTAQINTEDGFNKLVEFVQNNKIHHVSNTFKGESFDIFYLDREGNVVREESFNHYNEYLFKENNPILTTDLVRMEDDKNPIAQVGMEYDNLHEIGQAPLYKRPETKGDTSDRKTSKSSKTNSTVEEINSIVSKNSFDTAFDLIDTQVDMNIITDDFELFMTSLNKTIVNSNPALLQYSTEDVNDYIIFKLKEIVDTIEYPNIKKGIQDRIKEGSKISVKEVVAEALEVKPLEPTASNTKAVESPLSSTEPITNANFFPDFTSTDQNDEIPFRRVVSKAESTIEEVENIPEVKEWFNKNLPNIPLEVVSKIIATMRGNAWGAFTGKAVKLYESAEVGTGYHEAFHAIFRIGLTKIEQKKLLDLIRKEVSPNITDSEAEELLAEDFRNWMLYGKSDLYAPNKIKRNFFNKIVDFIKDIINKFTGTKGTKNLLDLYSKINTGGFAHIKATSEDIVQDNWKLRQVGNLDVATTEAMLSGLSVKVMQQLYTEHNANFTNFASLIDGIIKQAMYNAMVSSNTLKEISDTIRTSPYKVLNALRDHFNYIGLAIDVTSMEDYEDFEQLAVEEEARGSNLSDQITESVEVSNLRRLSNDVKLLIATLPNVEVKDGVVIDSDPFNTGLPYPVDFAPTYNKLLETLSGTLHWDGENGMLSKIKSLTKTNPEFIKLVNRLEGLTGTDAIRIKNAFRQAFSINKYGYMTYLVGKDGGKFVESNMSRSIDKLREQIDSGYKLSSIYISAKSSPSTIKNVNKSIVTKLGEVSKLIGSNNKLALKSVLDNVISTLNIPLSSKALLKNAEALNDFVIAFTEIFNKDTFIPEISSFKQGRIKNVLENEVFHSKDFYEQSHRNPENKNVYEFSLNNYYTTVVNTLNNAFNLPNQADILPYIETNLPHFKTIAKYSEWYTRLSNAINAGRLDEKFQVVFLEGMREEISGKEGSLTYDLSETDIATMHIEASLMHGVHTFRRPGDKSLEPAIKGFGKMDTFNLVRLGVILPKYIQFELDNGGLKAFDAILSEATKKKIALKSDNISLFKVDIVNDFIGYIENQTTDLLNLFTELKVFTPRHTTISPEVLNKFKDRRSLVEMFALNYFISRMEQHIIFLGDLGQFKQLYKRTSGPTGTGETYSQDKHTTDFIQEGYIQELSKLPKDALNTRLDLVLKLSPAQRESIGITSNLLSMPSTINSVNIVILKERVEKIEASRRNNYKDILESFYANTPLSEEEKTRRITGYMVIYDSMKIGDGLGYVSIDKYRHLLIASSKWDFKKQEASYQKIINKETLTPEDIAVFPIIKPQGFGPKAYKNIFINGNITTEEFNEGQYKVAFEKLSLAPLIPTATQGLEVDNLLKSLQVSGADIAIFESGFKDATKENVVDFNGEEMLMPSFNQSLSFLKTQLEIHPDVEEMDIDGSQQRKLIWQDLFGGGIPVDYVGDNWHNLDISEKKAQSGLYKLYEEYSDLYNSIIEAERDKFLRELTIKKINTGLEVKYEIQDYEKFSKEIRKEINKRRLPSNILKALTIDTNGKMLFPIDALPIADKIEAILFARAVNNTIRLKRPGAAYVQTSNVYYKTSKKWLLAASENRLNSEDLKKAEMFAKKLDFVYSKDGKIVAAEVYLPNYMRSIIGDNADIEAIREKQPQLFRLLGYRIPTQGQNSMLPIVVKGFLPAEMGDTVIVPYEIVAQSGSDFDIDKLHIFRPVSYKDANGNVQYVKTTENIDVSYKAASKEFFARKKSLLEEVKKEEERLRKEGIDYEELLKIIVGAEEDIENFQDFEEDDNRFEREIKKSSVMQDIMDRRNWTFEDISFMSKRAFEKSSRQNRLLEIQLEILSNVGISKNLITPNSAEILKEEAAFTEYLEELGKSGNVSAAKNGLTKNDDFYKWYNTVYKQKQNAVNYLDLISYRHELKTGSTFKGGKKGVAIVANYGTFHALAQQVGLVLTGKLSVSTPSREKDSNGKAIVRKSFAKAAPINFNFKYNTRKVGGISLPALGNVYDVYGSLISEQFSEHLTANVDISEDPFIFKLNTNGITSNVKYMMLLLGSGTEFADRFLTQPIILEYVNEVLKNESITIQTTKSKVDYVDGEKIYMQEYESKHEILERLYTKYTGIEKLPKDMSITEVLEAIHAEKNIINIDQLNRGIYYSSFNTNNKDFIKTQLQVLSDFISYMEYAKAFSAGVQSIKPDTAKVRSNSEATTILNNIEEVLKSELFLNIGDIAKASLLKGFSANHAKLYKEVYKELFITELDNIQKYIYTPIKEDLTLNNTKLTDKEVDKIRQGIMTYLLQIAINKNLGNGNTPISPVKIKELLSGEDSIAKTLVSYAKKLNNKALNDILFAKLADTSTGLDLVKVFNKTIDPFTADVITESFEEIHQKAPELYNQLLTIVAVQTGMVYSPINFLKYFDSTRIGNILKPVLDSIKYGEGFQNDIFNLTKSDSSNFITNFYLINRKNTKFVPVVKPSRKRAILQDGGNVFILSKDNNNYGRRFIRRFVVDAKTDSIVDVMYKLEMLNEDEAVYIKINPKGGFFLQEYHGEDSTADENIIHKENQITSTIRKTLVDKYSKTYDIMTEDVIATPYINTSYYGKTNSGVLIASLVAEQNWEKLSEEVKINFIECN